MREQSGARRRTIQRFCKMCIRDRDGPAAKAGVLIGDVVISLGGTAVTDTDDIQGVLERHAVGQTIKAGVVRGGNGLFVDVVIGERPRRN